MSTTEHIRDGMSVVRYCGPGDTAGPHRIRLGVHSQHGHIDAITVQEALLIAKALVHLAIDGVCGEMQANGHGRTD